MEMLLGTDKRGWDLVSDLLSKENTLISTLSRGREREGGVKLARELDVND